MHRYAVCLTGLLLILTMGSAEAQEAARDWLVLLDEGAYARSWDEAAGYFRNAVPRDEWVETLDAVRRPLGRVVSREMVAADYTTSLPGAPDGEYVVVRFRVSFENKKSAVETVTPVIDPDGRVRVTGYYIR